MEGKRLNEKMRQVGFVLLLLSMLVLFVNELHFFISAFLGAFTLYMLLRLPYIYLTEKKRWNKLITNFSLLTITVIILVGFGAVLFGTGFMKIKSFSPDAVVDMVTKLHALILQRTGYNLFSADVTSYFVGWMSNLIPNLFNLTNSVFSNFIMMIFILFFLLKGGKRMEENFEKLIPLSPESTALLKNETRNIVVSNAIGIPAIIVLQAFFSFCAYWFVGIKDPLLWGVLTGLFGVVPILGTAIIWFPLSVFLLLTDQLWAGIGLILYNLLVTTNVDNVFRIYFLDKFAQVHPLITVFGIILGINLFGFWGIIFGPLLLSGFFILLKIYRKEFLSE